MAKTAKKENPAKTEDDENTAEDKVWKDLIEANPDALEWKTKTISNYDELYMLFAKDRATGVVVETTKEKRKRMMNNEDIVEIDDDTDEFQSTNNKIADAMKECTKAIVGSRPHVYSGGEIYSQLELMGVDQDLKASAFVFLLRSPESTRALLDCPLDMQKSILNEMMGTRN
ncbi:hypothetical protein Tco_0084073 [Tanacetum coccineum]